MSLQVVDDSSLSSPLLSDSGRDAGSNYEADVEEGISIRFDRGGSGSSALPAGLPGLVTVGPGVPNESAFTLPLNLAYLVNGIMSVVFVAFVAMASPRIKTVLKVTDAKAGYIMSMIGVIYAATAGTNPFFMKWFGFRTVFAIALGSAAAGSALMANWGSASHEPGLPRVIASCILSPIGYSLTNSSIMKRVGLECRNNPKVQTQAFGFLTLVMSLCRCVATMWTGVMLNFNAGGSLYYGNVVLCFITFIACLFMPAANLPPSLPTALSRSSLSSPTPSSPTPQPAASLADAALVRHDGNGRKHAAPGES